MSGDLNDRDALEAVGKKIDAKRKKENIPSDVRPLGGSRMAIELASAVGVGCLFGYYMDKWLETSPIFFIIWVLFGVAAGVINIYKLAVKNTESEGDSLELSEPADK